MLISQEATAIAFETELARLNSDECYFNSISRELEPKRAFTAKFLIDAGFKPIIPEGGYFMIADWSALGGLALKLPGSVVISFCKFRVSS